MSNWVRKNLPEFLWLLDEEGALDYLTEVMDFERQNQTGIITSFMDLFDADNCPVEYLPYLANTLGFELESQDSEISKRNQIRTAIQRYREKGTISAFETLFNSLGYNVVIEPLWMDKQGNIDTGKENEPGWFPHARIDVYLTSRDTGEPLDSDLIVQMLQRMEEVRPCNVLLRGIFFQWAFNDGFGVVEDELEGTTVAQFSDAFGPKIYRHNGEIEAASSDDPEAPKRDGSLTRRGAAPVEDELVAVIRDSGGSVVDTLTL